MAKVYKRDNSPFYWGRVTHKGQEHRKSLETEVKRIAEERLTEWLKELKGTNWGEKPRRKFDDAAIKFAEEHIPTLKPSSRKRYHVSLGNLSTHFEGKFLDEITSGPLSEFEHARRSAGVSNGTIRRDLSCLSSLLRSAEEWEWILGNAAAAFLRTRSKRGLKEAPPRNRYFSHEEEALIVRSCREVTMKDGGSHRVLAAAILFAIDTGLRKEEMLSLTWDLIDLDRKEVIVPNEKAKSKVGRIVPILPRSLELLRGLPRHHSSRFVFWHGKKGERYFDLYPRFQDALEIARIPDGRWHDLRRTCGCRLLQDHQISMERVSKWLGHSSMAVTQKVYAFLDVKHLHKAVDESKLLPAQNPHSDKWITDANR